MTIIEEASQGSALIADAAQAGKDGKRFAVATGEVRTLAE